MAQFAAALPMIIKVAQVVGTVVSAVSALRGGQAQQQQANYQADQMNVQAGQERASSQREAIAQRQRADLAESRATTLAAAGGGTALDPTVVDILGGLEAEGDYRADTALFEGEERARALESGATIKRYEGKQAASAGKMSAVTTLLSGGASLFDKYSSPSDQTQTPPSEVKTGTIYKDNPWRDPDSGVVYA